MFHASNLFRQILWARSVSFPAVTNIRSTLTTRQKRWQNPTHSVDLTRVVMRQVRVKTTYDVTRITYDSSIVSSFPLPPGQKRTSGGGTVSNSGQCHMFFSQLAASLNDQYKADIYWFRPPKNWFASMVENVHGFHVTYVIFNNL